MAANNCKWRINGLTCLPELWKAFSLIRWPFLTLLNFRDRIDYRAIYLYILNSYVLQYVCKNFSFNNKRVQCLEVCPLGTYGVDCMGQCSCQHGGACDARTGACSCRPGWRGEWCHQRACEDGKWGPRCDKDCECNPATTDMYVSYYICTSSHHHSLIPLSRHNMFSSSILVCLFCFCSHIIQLFLSRRLLRCPSTRIWHSQHIYIFAPQVWVKPLDYLRAILFFFEINAFCPAISIDEGVFFSMINNHVNFCDMNMF
jgi:hypothetical protein